MIYPRFLFRLYSWNQNRRQHRHEVSFHPNISGEVNNVDFLNLVSQRYSCRSFKRDEVEKEKLDRILACAQLAPTAANRQAVRIIVFPTAGREQDVARIYSRGWFQEAPCLICVCSIPSQCWVRGDRKNYSDVDAAIVMDHIVLAATALDLGTCWVAAFDESAAREILRLDPAWEPVAFTPLGYRNDVPGKKMRKSLDEIVVYR